jgi:Immunity protein 10
MRIQANMVTVNKESSAIQIGFADDEHNPKNYVLLSFDQEETEEGLYIELNDQKWSGCGLIHRIQLLDSSVLIELTENGPKELNTDSRIMISILPTVQNWPALRTRIDALLQQWMPNNL